MKEGRYYEEILQVVCTNRYIGPPITAVASYDDADQPHMQAALEALQQAKHHLEEAKHDKGGHRVAAIKAIDSAIHHVKEGMEAGEKHEGKK